MHILIFYLAQCEHLEDLVNSGICNQKMKFSRNARLARGLWEVMAFGAPREPCAGVNLDL